MNQQFFFHDGNLVSLTWTGSKTSTRCKIVLDLYADLESSQRCRHILVFRKLRSISFAGDCVEIARNYFAGVIQDGFIEDANGFQKLSMQLTGGALVVEGLLEIGAS
jgi:hypothetical protein